MSALRARGGVGSVGAAPYRGEEYSALGVWGQERRECEGRVSSLMRVLALRRGGVSIQWAAPSGQQPKRREVRLGLLAHVGGFENAGRLVKVARRPQAIISPLSGADWAVLGQFVRCRHATLIELNQPRIARMAQPGGPLAHPARSCRSWAANARMPMRSALCRPFNPCGPRGASLLPVNAPILRGGLNHQSETPWRHPGRASPLRVGSANFGGPRTRGGFSPARVSPAMTVAASRSSAASR